MFLAFGLLNLSYLVLIFLKYMSVALSIAEPGNSSLGHPGGVAQSVFCLSLFARMEDSFSILRKITFFQDHVCPLGLYLPILPPTLYPFFLCQV